MLHFLKLIRWQNLVLLILSQCLIKYALFEPFGAALALNGVNFWLIVLASVCIACAGNIINDIYDVTTDTINKPKRVIIGTFISEKTATNWFIIFNSIGLGIGFYVANSIGKSSFASIFALTSILLYIYTSNLKGIPFVGNAVISIIVSASLLVIPIYDLLPETNSSNRNFQFAYFKIILWYSIAAFTINLLRELVKDIEDTNGDYKAGYNTLPVVIGRNRATRLAFVIAFIPLIGVVYYLVNHLNKNLTAVIYFLITVVAPMLYIVIKLFSAKHQNHYKHISLVLKLVMLAGILSLLLYPLTLK